MRRPRALVFGLGRFGGGAAATRYLAARGTRVRVADRATAEDLRDSVAWLEGVPDVEFALGREDAALLDGVDQVVCNPAVPDGHPLLAVARERGVPITQEVNLFLEDYPGQVVAVTGTNGKSTTSTLIAAALRRSGVPTLLGGNIGNSLLDDAGSWHRDQVAVLEISSYQLERADPARHRVRGAVFTRVTADHLDRHGTLAAYHAAKARAARMAGGFVVRGADDAVAAGFAHDARTLVHGAGDTDATVRDGAIVDRHGRLLLRTGALLLPGSFQVENVMAAWLAAAQLGADRHAAGVAFALTRPLRHRLQLIASIEGRQIYDNAVSTQVDSTLSALRDLRGPIRWVGGGRSKDGEYLGPGALLSELVTSAHLFGDAAGPLGDVMAPRVQTTVHERLEAALDAAWAACAAGETILFSPAFASFDQFPNFRARAACFDRWVSDVRERRFPTGS